jgi:pyruvate,water dikinase
VLDRDTGARRSVTAGNGEALDEDALRAVVDLARRAEALFGAPQDVEWAVGADGPVLLQSRPITVDSEPALDPRIEQLTRANVGEVLPLTASSMLVRSSNTGSREVMRLAGIGEDGGPPSSSSIASAVPT